MSGFRVEDDEDDNRQSSSGLGIAGLAIAVGVGIGSIIYYAFNKPQQGSEGAHAFRGRTGSIEICCICLNALLREERETRLRCGHNYHLNCLTPWLQRERTCPICRRNV